MCGEDDWSNEAHDACVPKIIEFLAFGEPLGITLIVISAFGALVTIAVGVKLTRMMQDTKESLPLHATALSLGGVYCECGHATGESQ